MGIVCKLFLLCCILGSAGCRSQDASSPLLPGKRRLECSVQLPRQDDPLQQYLVTFTDTEGGRTPINFFIRLEDGSTTEKTISTTVDTIVRLRTTMAGTMHSKADVIAMGKVQITLLQESTLFRELKEKEKKTGDTAPSNSEPENRSTLSPALPDQNVTWEEKSSLVQVTSTPPSRKPIDYTEILDALQNTPPPPVNSSFEDKNPFRHNSFDYHQILKDMIDSPPENAGQAMAQQVEETIATEDLTELNLEPGIIWVLPDGKQVYFEELPEEETIDMTPPFADLHENGLRIFIKIHYTFSITPAIEWPLFARGSDHEKISDEAMHLEYLDSFLLYPGEHHIVEIPGEPQQ